jgi:hypothetical protein
MRDFDEQQLPRMDGGRAQIQGQVSVPSVARLPLPSLY